jgi:NADH:ubiquinone oxidoreductase subunit E
VYKITIEGSIMSMVTVGTKTSPDRNPGIVGKYPASRDALIPILQGVHEAEGYIFRDRIRTYPGVCAIAPVMTANGKLYGRLDTKREVRQSYKNEQVMSLYRTYLHEPGSQRAHELLHTRYGECRR